MLIKEICLITWCSDLCIMHTLPVKHAIKIISQAIKGQNYIISQSHSYYYCEYYYTTDDIADIV